MKVRRVQRSAMMLVATALILASLPNAASAWTLTTRKDPNDSRNPLDIRKVSTDLSRRHVYIRIGTWERLPRRGEGEFAVLMDTRGSKYPDRVIEMLPYKAQCVIEKWDGGVGRLVGYGDGRRADTHDLACRLPARWLPIKKPVRFSVELNAKGRDADRAPDHHYYVGL